MADIKRLVIVRGLSGSGKTTIADLICDVDNDNRISISSDDFFYDEDGNYSFDPEAVRESHEWCKAEVENCMAQGFSVIVVHNTFTRKWEVDPYINYAMEKGYEVSILSLFDAGLNDAQLASRTPHGVPFFQIRKQRMRWEVDMFRPENNPRNSRYRNNYKNFR